MYSEVLVPLDGSHLAAEAIPQAVAIAREFEARLILLRVLPAIEDEAGTLGRRELETRRSQAEGYLQALQRSLSGLGITIEVKVIEGLPVGAILEEVEQLERPLIVMTSIGKTSSLTPIRAGILGGVAEEVLRQVTTPVLVIRPASPSMPSGQPQIERQVR